METPCLLSLSSPCSVTTSLGRPSENISPLSSPTRNTNLSSTNFRCCYTKKPTTSTSGTSSRKYWDSNAQTLRSERFKFNFQDESIDEDDDTDAETGFRWRENLRKRKWWSDDDSQQGSGLVEEAIESIWFFKVLRSFGWMLPAIIISMLLATGPKAFLMALALPLGQSAVSFAIDKVFRRTRYRPKPRTKTKRKPFARATSTVEMNEEELDESDGTSEGRQGYQSWVAIEDNPVQKDDQHKPSFGGWDELDRRRGIDTGPTRRERQTTRRPSRPGVEKGKLSRRGRPRDAPFLLRLLIAVFPFLGSWTRLL